MFTEGENVLHIRQLLCATLVYSLMHENLWSHIFLRNTSLKDVAMINI